MGVVETRVSLKRKVQLEAWTFTTTSFLPWHHITSLDLEHVKICHDILKYLL
jgi:hypothetical protein